MKVILLEDVKALGKKGQVVEVSDGYAKNFILKKKLGLEATGANMNDLKLQKARDEKEIQLPESIKTFGMHEVPVKLHPQVTGKLHVKVVEA